MRKKNTESIGEVLQQFFAENEFFKQKLGENRILNGWPELLGASIASYTTNLYIRNSVLYVQVSSSVLRSELLINRHSLIKKLNKHAGMEVIKDIVFR
jgi:predicted nucleic acid-binding Zn ribbon protein